MYLRLLGEGHDVRVSVASPWRPGPWRAWFLEARMARRTRLAARGGQRWPYPFRGRWLGALQNDLRAQALKVIGGSAFGDRLETTALLRCNAGQQGLCTPPVQQFTMTDDALVDLANRPRRCVYKVSASAGDTSLANSTTGARSRFPPIKARQANRAFILWTSSQASKRALELIFNGRRFLGRHALIGSTSAFSPGTWVS